ncbi:hypothetical protein B0H12DRAFT_611666 [Mycena haematopus]|nr:hypothetical protein B0H12DRAFT_611666 [Mycena haematopus]
MQNVDDHDISLQNDTYLSPRCAFYSDAYYFMISPSFIHFVRDLIFVACSMRRMVNNRW